MRLVAHRLLLLLVALCGLALVVAPLMVADRYFAAPGAGRDYVLRIPLPAGGQLGLPPVEGPLDASRPLVVIDAGHGGHDPGAGAGALQEKAVTLALAEALRARLLADGGVRVALTRDADRFLLLPERAAIARELKADLFISIHADSATNPEAWGATLYTLSNRGSNEEAVRIAASENRADTVNGVALSGQSDAVSAILVDLSQRESAARAEEFARLVLREGAGKIDFRERSIQSAAFIVLKSADVPSVLFEAGYLSNPGDAARLASPEGREAFAEVTARAIRVHFARRLAPPPVALPAEPPAPSATPDPTGTGD
ncbi:N-acetylmuramoyl-L-alanine amidase [Novosphingobium bradum]|uniref:N-acetylmuramoyl-L-alanine amidase n=1 Tax=Novosphingobium bradum TaxID=1737444 RepID=A0ABV7ITH6_9SPHN